MVSAKCTNCGASIQVDEGSEAGVCPYCSTAYITEKAIKNVSNVTSNNAQVINNYYGGNPNNQQTSGKERKLIEKDGKNIFRFLLTFFLGFIGSFIINHSSLKPEGHTSRTKSYLFWGYFTLGIYSVVASISNISFNPNLPSNIGYIREYY